MINAAMVPVAIITLALAAFCCRREKRKSLVIVMVSGTI
jgi:hypothetical protein